MRERTKDRIAAIIVAPFFIAAVLAHAMWEGAKRPLTEFAKAAVISLVFAVVAVLAHQWAYGALNY